MSVPTPGGSSGVLTFGSNVIVSDGNRRHTVLAANAALVLRPNGRTNTSQVTAGDTLAMTNVLDAVANLRLNAVPDIDGAYKLLSGSDQRTPVCSRTRISSGCSSVPRLRMRSFGPAKAS
ncbi:MAG: hypothetical protein WDN04_16710 [Rhodospirillales bacterium]